MATESTMRVCVGNYGYYNEGTLRDQWIELPKEPAELAGWLRDAGLVDDLHEETYISDYDGIPFASVPEAFTEYTRLEDLNLLAMQLSMAAASDIDKADMWLEASGEVGTVGKIMNLLEQVDDIPVYSYDHEYMGVKDSWGQDWSQRFSPAENYGYTCLENMPELKEILDSDSAAAHAFDVGRYGETRAELDGVTLFHDGYADMSAGEPDLEYYTHDELEESVLGDWRQAREAEEAREAVQPVEEPEVAETSVAGERKDKTTADSTALGCKRASLDDVVSAARSSAAARRSQSMQQADRQQSAHETI